MSFRSNSLNVFRRNQSANLIEALEPRRLFTAALVDRVVAIAPTVGWVVAAAQTPPAVQGVEATPISTSSVAIQWTPSTYNDSDPENTYHVYELTGDATRTLVAAPGNTPSAQIDGLAPGSQHVFAVTVLDSDGNESPLSASVSVRTFAPPTLADPNPNHLSLRAAAESPFTFAFSASGNPAPTFSLIDGPSGAAIDPTTGMLQWTPTADQIGPAVVTASAANDWGVDQATLELTIVAPGSDLTPPSIVTGVTVSNPNRHGADVAWNPASDDVGVDRYRLRIYSDATTPTPLVQLDTAGAVTATTVNDTVLAYNATYQLKVTAVDAAGNESDLASTPFVALATANVDVVKPTAPMNVAVAEVTTSTVTLSWTAAADNVGVVGYRIYRRTVIHNPKGSGSTVHYSLLKDQISPADTLATVDGLSSGTNYSMVVEAYDAEGNATKSAPVGFKTLAPPTLLAAALPDTVAGQQTLAFYPSYSGTPTPDLTLVSGPEGMTVTATPSGATLVQWTPAGSVAAGDYSFTLRATNAVGSVERSYVVKVLPADTDITPPAQPTDFSIDGVTPNSADLSWVASSDNVGVDHYAVHFFAQIGYRKQFNRTYTVPATADVRTTTTISGLVAGKSYAVSVTAFDAAGNASFPLGGSVRTPPAAPAAVQDVYVSGSSWSQSFKDRLALQPDQDAGSAVNGYLLADWTGGGRGLPYVNLDALALRFTGPAPAAIAAGAISVTSSGSTLGVASVAVSPVDSAVLLIKLQQALPRGLVELRLAGLLDETGAAVDVKLNVVPGDVDGDGKVAATDLVLTRNHLGAHLPTSAAFDLFNDFDGDGVISAVDLVQVRNRI